MENIGAELLHLLSEGSESPRLRNYAIAIQPRLRTPNAVRGGRRSPFVSFVTNFRRIIRFNSDSSRTVSATVPENWIWYISRFCDRNPRQLPERFLIAC